MPAPPPCADCGEYVAVWFRVGELRYVALCKKCEREGLRCAWCFKAIVPGADTVTVKTRRETLCDNTCHMDLKTWRKRL